MRLPARSLCAATTALAVAVLAAPAATAATAAPAATTASTRFGPAMSAATVRTMQSQGVTEIIVKRRPGLSVAQEAALRAKAGVGYVGPGPLPDTELDRAPAGGLAATVAALRQDPQVQYAEPNGEIHAALAPNDPYFGQQWALSNTGQFVWDASGTPGDDIGALYAWPRSTGANVTVAVVDTGIDETNADLQGRIVAGYDYVDGDSNPQDQNGHGTHVSGIIAADQNNFVGVSGVAPSAKLMPLRVLDASGNGTIDDVAAAFNYAGQHGVPIVNASLGGAGSSQTLADAVANNPNTLYVVAAGNSGTDNDDPSSPFYPCDLPDANLICVGASDQNDQPAWFSDYGASTVDLFAPGVNILSTWTGGQYYMADGTSMATPMVTGTLALMLARNPALGASALKADLLASVDPEPQLAGLSVTGGELDAAAAVATSGGDAPYAPPGNRAAPTVEGDPVVGGTLTATPGGWSRAPTNYSYQWQRCVLGACLPVPGATNTDYPLSQSDQGASLEVQVSATNAAGSTVALSAPTAAVGLPGPNAPPTPPASTGSGPTPPPATSVTPRFATPVHRSGLSLSHVAVRAGRTLVFTLSAPARVQITLGQTAASRAIVRRSVNGRRGGNRQTVAALLRGRRLRSGRYALTVRAGGHAATVWLNLG